MIMATQISYIGQDRKTDRIVSVCLSEKDENGGEQVEKELDVNQWEISYELPDNMKIEERGM